MPAKPLPVPMKKADPGRRNSKHRTAELAAKAAFQAELPVIVNVFSSAIYDGFSYGVSFRWNPELQKVINTKLKGYFNGDKSSPYYRCWVFRQTVAEETPQAVQELLESARLEVSPASFMTWLSQAQHDRFAFTRGIEVKIYTLKTGGFVIKTNRFHPSFPRFHGPSGGTYLHGVKAWLYNEDANLSILVGEMQQFCALTPSQFELVPGLFILDSDVAKRSNDVTMELGQCMAPVPGEKNPWEDAFKDNSTILLPEMIEYQQEVIDEAEVRARIEALPLLLKFQQSGAVFMATRPGAANFSEQGTGKTFVSIAAAYAANPTGPKLIICPLNKQYDWREEILRLLPDAKVSVTLPSRDAEWVILSLTKVGRVRDWKDHFKALLIDEAHLIKESSTARTKEILDVAATIPRAYVLTGTPIPNREMELWTLLKVTRHPLGKLSKADFQERFCGTPEARARLAAAIRPWFVRVMKLDVLSLPPKHRHKVVVEPTEEFAAEYNEIMDSTELKGMDKVHQLCQALERFKIQWLMNQIESIPDDEKAIVFTGYNATLEELEEEHATRGIGFIKAIAGGPEHRRHGYVTSFRDDENLRVYCGTIHANGTGLNLQRGSRSFVMTPPWTAAILSQAEDRAHRFGQTRPVHIHLPLVRGTLDEQIYELVIYKAALSDSVLSPEEQLKKNEAAILKTLDRPRRLVIQREAPAAA